METVHASQNPQFDGVAEWECQIELIHVQEGCEALSASGKYLDAGRALHRAHAYLIASWRLANEKSRAVDATDIGEVIEGYAFEVT